MIFEHRLKDILRRDNFKPFEKFLTVKILVSIAFIQEFVLSVIMGSLFKASEVQIKLGYACLLCYEVFPISLMVLYSWRPVANDWYKMDGGLPGQDGGETAPHGQLADEHAPPQLSGDFIASRQPSAMVPNANPLGDSVEATIELHGRVSALEGKALEDLVNSMSRTIFAVYKPAALFRERRGRRAASISSPDLSGIWSTPPYSSRFPMSMPPNSPDHGDAPPMTPRTVAAASWRDGLLGSPRPPVV